MGWSEKELCIRCNKGGKVLACADSCCPIAVHETCMLCPSRFNDLGEFLCPHCVYKQSVLKYHLAKEHVLSKKKALHTFIDKGMIGCGKKMPSMVSNSKRKRADESLPEKPTDVSLSNCGQQLVVEHQIQAPDVASGSKYSASCKVMAEDFGVLDIGNRVQVEIEEVSEHQLKKSIDDHQQDAHLSNLCVSEEEKMGNERVLTKSKRSSVEISREQMQKEDCQTTSSFMSADPTLQRHLKVKREVETRDSSSTEAEPVSTCRKRGKQVDKVRDDPINTEIPRRLTRTSASAQKNTNAACKANQVKQPAVQLPVELPNVRRSRVLWKHEEEKMLEEGVKEFSTKVNKNLPWRKILEFGGHVFDKIRTPTDLKDKWKQICSKNGGHR